MSVYSHFICFPTTTLKQTGPGHSQAAPPPPFNDKWPPTPVRQAEDVQLIFLTPATAACSSGEELNESVSEREAGLFKVILVKVHPKRVSVDPADRRLKSVAEDLARALPVYADPPSGLFALADGVLAAFQRKHIRGLRQVNGQHTGPHGLLLSDSPQITELLRTERARVRIATLPAPTIATAWPAPAASSRACGFGLFGHAERVSIPEFRTLVSWLYACAFAIKARTVGRRKGARLAIAAQVLIVLFRQFPFFIHLHVIVLGIVVQIEVVVLDLNV
mmetsp:Transcript_17142/g.49044  ORF Transcript_17142/g.49044 Transcript_17142/m.49044 type:complete len:277 (-) Transcript_17142:382-1212(-)